MNPEFPIYIASKGRADTRLTMKVFERLRVPYRVIVERPEYESYAAVIDPKKLMVLDPKYQRDYEPYCNLQPHESRGSGPARNFAWDHAMANGHAWHWIIDDNIECFFRMNRNLRVPVADGSMFKAMEAFATRYNNVALAGPDYVWQATARKIEHDPFTINTRIYSCILIRNDIGFRWRGRYNEDTDLSLRVLKSGWCTVMFKAFLQRKMTTLTMRGGNTDSIYAEGTLAKSRMLVNMHPDVARLAWRFKRWHHVVDYRRFKNQKLIAAKPIKRGVNNFGMELVKAERTPYVRRDPPSVALVTTAKEKPARGSRAG